MVFNGGKLPRGPLGPLGLPNNSEAGVELQKKNNEAINAMPPERQKTHLGFFSAKVGASPFFSFSTSMILQLLKNGPPTKMGTFSSWGGFLSKKQRHIAICGLVDG